MDALVCPDLVGRDDVLGLLHERLAAAADGRGGTVLLMGEAGIGKSRLARQLAADAASDGFVVLPGRAVDTDHATPYRPIAEAVTAGLRRCGEPDDPGLLPYRPALGRIVPGWRRDDVVGSAESSIVLGESVLRLLAGWATGRGVVLVLDDLHWCDPDTLAVVEYLADHVHDQRVVLVATTRPEAAGGGTARSLGARRAATLVNLPPLDPPQVAAVAAGCLGTADLPDGLADVLRRADGVPFLVEELLAAAADRGALRRDGSGWVLGPGAARVVPGTFAAGVAQRLGSLARSDRDVVLAGAVLGRRFDEAVPAGMVGRPDDDVREALRRGVAAQLLVLADGEFAFRHALTRDAVLACLTSGERADLARRARAVIEAQHPGQPGVWAEAAADLAVMAGEHDRAAGLLLSGARAALADGALRTARKLLDRARDVVGLDSSRSAEIDEALLQVAAEAGDSDAAREIGDRLAGADLDPDRRAHVHLLLAGAAAAATAWGEAEDQLARCRRTAPADSVPRIDALAAHVALGQDRVEEAVALARRALESARRLDHAETACRALEVLGRIARPHDVLAAEAAFGEELRIATRHGLTLWIVRATHELGTLDVVRSVSPERLVRARELASTAGALATVATLDLQLAAVFTLRWEVAAAVDAARRCAAAARRWRLGLLLPAALSFEAYAHAIARRRRDMETAIDAALATGCADVEMEATTWSARAMLSLLGEDRARATAELDTSLVLLRPDLHLRGRWPYLGLWALLRTVEDTDGAGARREVRAVISDDALLAWGLLSYADAVELGRSGRATEAGEAFAAAERTTAHLTAMSGFRHLCRRLVAECAIAHGWGTPHVWLADATEFFGAVGQAPLERACRSLLRKCGAPAPRRPGSVDLARLSVTDREAEVLALLADGLTSREIGERLFISRRTVDKHVERLAAKTGVSRRSALRSFAREALR